MATPGDANSVGAVNVDVGANLDPLIQGLEQAKQAAQQKGEEIGRAASEGVAKGAAEQPATPQGDPTRSGGTVGPQYWKQHGAVGPASSYASNDEWMAAVKADAASSLPPMAAAGGGGGVAGAAVGAAAAGALVFALEQLGQQLLRLERIGEVIGNGLFEGVKKQAELDNAIERLNTSIARQSALDEMRFQRVAGANVNIDPNMLADVSAKEAQAQSAEQQFIKHDAKASWWDRISQGLEKGSRFGPFGLLSYTGVLSHTSDLTQEEEQARELRGEADRARKPMTDILRRQRERGTMGGVVARVADEQGIEHGTLGTGVALDPASARVLEEALRNNAAMTAKLVEALSRSNQQNNDRAASLAIGRQVQTR